MTQIEPKPVASNGGARLKSAYRGLLAEALPRFKELSLAKSMPPQVLSFEIAARLEQLESLSECVLSLEEDSVFSRHLNTLVATGYGASRIEARDLVVRILVDYLRRVPEATFEEEVFEDLCSEQETYLKSDTLDVKAITPLLNLKGDFDTVDLEPGLRIKKFSELDRELFPPNTSMMQDISPAELALTGYAIEQTYSVSKKYDAKSSELCEQSRRDQRSNLATVLRLFKTGVVGTKVTAIAANQWTPRGGAIRLFSIYQPFYMGTPFDITKSETGSLKSFYQEFKSFNTAQFDPALRRFNMYYDRPSDEDRLIDAMIAFESLLLPEKDELSLRLAIRVANLMGTTPVEKRFIFAFLRKAYDVRSNVVHGTPYEPTIKVADKEYSLTHFVRQVEEYLRQTLVELLRRRKTETKSQTVEQLTNPF